MCSAFHTRCCNLFSHAARILCEPRDKILQLGKKVGASGKPVSLHDKDRAAAEWLVGHEFASYTAQGQLVLLSAALQTTTILEGPRPVSGPTDNLQDSVWGLRRKLFKKGWSSGPASTAAASTRHYNEKNAFRQYLALLLDRSLASSHFLDFAIPLPSPSS